MQALLLKFHECSKPSQTGIATENGGYHCFYSLQLAAVPIALILSVSTGLPIGHDDFNLTLMFDLET